MSEHITDHMRDQVLAAVGMTWTDWRDLGGADAIHCAGHMADRGELEESRQMLYRDNGHPCGCIVRFRKGETT